MRTVRATVLALALGAALPSCGGSSAARYARADHMAQAGDLAGAVDALRFAIAQNPRDTGAHVRLARLELRAGRPGAALRHYALAGTGRRSALTAADRTALAALYLDRARARVELGDIDAVADLRRARSYGPVVVPARLEANAELLAALGWLRASDAHAAKHARTHLRRLAVLAPNDPRLALLSPTAANLADLGVAASWLFDGGALRASLDVLDLYVERRGRAPDVLSRWMRAERWWRGSGASPLVVDDAGRAGADVCAVAAHPRDFGCADRTAAADPDALWARAERNHWRTRDPRLAGVFASLALRASAEGRTNGWFAGVSERVDLAAFEPVEPTEPTEWPGYAAATLLRAAGHLERAPRALDAAIEDAERMSASERAVVFAEAAVQGRGAEVLDRIALSGPVPDYAWVAAASAARASGDRGLELERLAHVGPYLEGYLAGHGDLALLTSRFGAAHVHTHYAHYALLLARWNDVLAAADVARGRRVALERWGDALGAGWHVAKVGAGNADMPVTTADAVDIAVQHGLSDPDALRGFVAIAAGHARDPALAVRLAEDFVDADVAMRRRGPAVAALLLRLGEPEHAYDWAMRLLAANERDSDYLMLAGATAAARGSVDEAEVHFIGAAATSGDPGASHVAAARHYLELQLPLAAVAAGRRALEHTAPGEDHAALEILSDAMLRLGRRDDAAKVLARSVERTPVEFRDAARATAIARLGDGPVPAVLAGPVWRSARTQALAADASEDQRRAAWRADPTDPDLAVAYAAIAGADAAAVLDVAIAWSPGHVGARVARMALATPGDDRYLELVAELVAIAISESHPSRRAEAARYLADHVTGVNLLSAGTSAPGG